MSYLRHISLFFFSLRFVTFSNILLLSGGSSCCHSCTVFWCCSPLTNRYHLKTEGRDLSGYESQTLAGENTDHPLLCDLFVWSWPMVLSSLVFLLIYGEQEHWGQACSEKLINKWETHLWNLTRQNLAESSGVTSGVTVCQSCFLSIVFQLYCERNLPLVSAEEEEELANCPGVHRTRLMESVLWKRLQAFKSPTPPQTLPDFKILVVLITHSFLTERLTNVSLPPTSGELSIFYFWINIRKKLTTKIYSYVSEKDT